MLFITITLVTIRLLVITPIFHPLLPATRFRFFSSGPGQGPDISRLGDIVCRARGAFGPRGGEQ
jgi:hypothetical protein